MATPTCSETVSGRPSLCRPLSCLRGPTLCMVLLFMPPFFCPLVPIRSASVVPAGRPSHLVNDDVHTREAGE